MVFLQLKTSEVLKNEWIRLYLQLAVATSNRNHLEEGVANLKILKVAMEITPHLEEEEPFYKGLGAYDAIFYIRYKDPCKARAGDDVDRVAIVRRVVDVHLETFILVGRTQTLTPAASNEIAAMEAIWQTNSFCWHNWSSHIRNFRKYVYVRTSPFYIFFCKKAPFLWPNFFVDVTCRTYGFLLESMISKI